MRTLEELKAFAKEGMLDDHVHDAKAAEAADINNDGPGSQVEYLVEVLGLAEVEKILVGDNE